MKLPGRLCCLRLQYRGIHWWAVAKLVRVKQFISGSSLFEHNIYLCQLLGWGKRHSLPQSRRLLRYYVRKGAYHLWIVLPRLVSLQLISQSPYTKVKSSATGLEVSPSGVIIENSNNVSMGLFFIFCVPNGSKQPSTPVWRLHIKLLEKSHYL